MVLQGFGTAFARGPVYGSTTDPNGNTTRWQVDGVGRPLQQVNHDGGTSKWTYSSGFLSSQSDPLGRSTVYSLDSLGYPTLITE